MMPIDIIAKEARDLYVAKKREPMPIEEAIEKVKTESKRRWQERWDASDKGRWTHRLIPQIESWLTRKHGEVNDHLYNS